MVQLLRKIEDGDAAQSELDLLLDVCDRILGKCLCPLGDAAAMPIASYVMKFREEFQAHVDRGSCPFGDSSTLDRLLAPSDQHAHDRRRPCMPDLVTVTIDDRSFRCRRARASSRRQPRPESRSPSSATSRGWAARRRLPHVPRRDRGHPEAAGRVHADGPRRHGREDRADVRARGRGAKRHARVHPRQPSARLPRLRQGRRVPAPGPHVPLRPRLDADDVRQADVRQADPDLAD